MRMHRAYMQISSKRYVSSLRLQFVQFLKFLLLSEMACQITRCYIALLRQPICE
jgi:hypothetical protein